MCASIVLIICIENHLPGVECPALLVPAGSPQLSCNRDALWLLETERKKGNATYQHSISITTVGLCYNTNGGILPL